MFDISNPIGGGEILNLGGEDKGYKYLDGGLIQQYNAVPLIATIIIVLLVTVCICLILRSYNIKHISLGKGVKNELKNISAIRKRDARILQTREYIRWLVKKVNGSPFKVSEIKRDYIEYNLKRANIHSIDGCSGMSVDEYNALVRTAQLIDILISVLIILFVNAMAGLILLIAGSIAIGNMPMICIRKVVAHKDLEIQENFLNLYLRLHYILLKGGNIPISRLMSSYVKSEDNEEMKRFVSICIEHIETYGEYAATDEIIKEFKEIPQSCKLQRLIKQQSDGGNVSQELEGFKRELIREQKYKQELRKRVIVRKFDISIKILYIILVQAIISAMAIYLPDLSLISSFMQ